MDQLFNSDKPIYSKEYDRFDRYKFSSRIADTIAKRNTHDGLVIGLYGVWGEGKSSVLNMIENDLVTKDNILLVKFNPWRFKDEDTLILNFFKNLSSVLDRELNNQKELIGKILKGYGNITSILGLDLTKVGETMSDASLDTLKGRVNKFLQESSKKVVVIIDDIDRLDKQELFALFKLIKLTADFTKTYYILSFDDDMVASAIGERYAEGNKSSGHNFLEKIIQVPLNIPQALPNSLLNYTLELLNDILKTNNIDLKEESSDVGYQISKNILPKIKTPRLAIRYANSLAFLIPLLSGEVNISDLILFDGLKLFYPRFYDFIKHNPDYFTESYENIYKRGPNDKKKEEFLQRVKNIGQGLSKNEQESVNDLLKHLFPITKEAFENYNYSYGDHGWEKEKRIASKKYFNRYFLYSVPTGEISDLYFEDYINKLKRFDPKELERETIKLISGVKPQEFLSKISLYNNNLDSQKRKILIELICKFQKNLLDRESAQVTIFLNERSNIAITLSDLLAHESNYNERFNIAKKLIEACDEFEFSYELLRWYRSTKSQFGPFIADEDFPKLEETLLHRALNESEQIQSNLFQSHSDHIYTLLEMWHQVSPDEVFNYIDKCMTEYDDFQEVIIDELTSDITSISGTSESYKTDFKRESYYALKKYYDIHKINKAFSKKKYKNIREIEVIFFDTDKGHTLETAIRQFIHWYDLDGHSNHTQINEEDISN